MSTTPQPPASRPITEVKAFVRMPAGGTANRAPSTPDRPAPPDLEFQAPDCSVCGQDTRSDGRDGYSCESCRISWDADGSTGEWEDPNEELCTATVQPWLDNTWIKDDDERKRKEFRCVLAAGHDDDEFPTPHANPEMGSVYAKGWR